MSDKQQLFLAFADRSINRPTKARMRAVEKRRMHRAQEEAVRKALAERDMLMRLWKRWRKEILTEALETKYGTALQKLVDFLKQLKFKEDVKLLPFIKSGPWLQAPKDIKFLVLTLISAQLVKLREQQELPPFDDPLPYQPLSPFLLIRNSFMGLK